MQVLLGERKLKPLVFRIVRRPVARCWWQFWRPGEEVYIETEYFTLGPMESVAAAYELLHVGLVRDDEIEVVG